MAENLRTPVAIRSKRRKRRKRRYISPQERQWRKLRLEVLREANRTCEKCQAKPTGKRMLAVDHILPKSLYPEFELTRDNLQVLCRRCNSAKGNRPPHIDYRAARLGCLLAWEDEQVGMYCVPDL